MVNANKVVVEDILNFPLVPKGVYTSFRKLLPHQKADSSEKIIENLQFLKQESEKKSRLSQLIFFDFKFFINHPEVAKRKTTATTIEQRISYLFGGQLTDTKSRQNPNIRSLISPNDLLNLSPEIQNKICSNYREKGDVLIGENFKVSVKSLMDNNNEINFGAFQYNTLFKGILDEDLLRIGERRNQIKKIIENSELTIGRGSRPQLWNLFKYIKHINKWDEFIERWRICFGGVFKEDTLIYIKDPSNFTIHLIDNKKFNNTVLLSLNQSQSDQIINRWEGNSIRMDKNKLIRNSSFSLTLNFDSLFDDSFLLEKFYDLYNQKTSHLLE